MYGQSYLRNAGEAPTPVETKKQGATARPMEEKPVIHMYKQLPEDDKDSARRISPAVPVPKSSPEKEKHSAPSMYRREIEGTPTSAPPKR